MAKFLRYCSCSVGCWCCCWYRASFDDTLVARTKRRLIGTPFDKGLSKCSKCKFCSLIFPPTDSTADGAVALFTTKTTTSNSPTTYISLYRPINHRCKPWHHQRSSSIATLLLRMSRWEIFFVGVCSCLMDVEMIILAWLRGLPPFNWLVTFSAVSKVTFGRRLFLCQRCSCVAIRWDEMNEGRERWIFDVSWMSWAMHYIWTDNNNWQWCCGSS